MGFSHIFLTLNLFYDLVISQAKSIPLNLYNLWSEGHTIRSLSTGFYETLLLKWRRIYHETFLENCLVSLVMILDSSNTYHVAILSDDTKINVWTLQNIQNIEISRSTTITTRSTTLTIATKTTNTTSATTKKIVSVHTAFKL